MEDKAALRKQARERRNVFFSGLSAAERERAFARPPSPFKALIRPGMIVSGYFAMGSEADPSALLRWLDQAGCAIALPHVASVGSPMRFLRWRHGDLLETGVYGLRQPDKDSPVCAPDLVLMPMLAFDPELNRLGQGAGFYDRALADLPDSIRIGLAWSVQQWPALPADPWDIRMNAVITEKEWITA